VQHETVSSTKIRKAISEGYIQRANAYLDHYYIIIGKPENHNFQDLTEFMRIQITEECKLLPSPGIYAVSVTSGSSNSKGMVLILDENKGTPEVMVHIFEDPETFVGKDSILLFHKKIHCSLSLSDPKTHTRIDSAKEEIIDLIY
jgi:riboflavin kinase/FMN adenylyltransferase